MARKRSGAPASVASHTVTLGEVGRIVAVSTGTEERPVGAFVIWLGGNARPVNFEQGIDLWLSSDFLIANGNVVGGNAYSNFYATNY